MNIYLVKREDKIGWDEYDSFVVACATEEEARNTYPDINIYSKNGMWVMLLHDGTEFSYNRNSWIPCSNIDDLTVKKIGTTETEAGIILASFNAG